MVSAVSGGGIVISTNFGMGLGYEQCGFCMARQLLLPLIGLNLWQQLQIEFITSTNAGGITWLKQTNAPALPWQSIASSADGTKLVAVAGGFYVSGPIYTSVDSGSTWTSNNAPVLGWLSVVSSADGNKLIAVAYNAGMWTAQSVPSPSLNLTSAGTNLSHCPGRYPLQILCCSRIRI